MIRRLAWLLLLASGGLAPQPTIVDEIEFNTFGEMPRTAIIYRDAAGRIIDWRWDDDVNKRPAKVSAIKWLAVWREGDKLLCVECQRVTYSRTLHDVELAERVKWPEHKRRKLR